MVVLFNRFVKSHIFIRRVNENLKLSRYYSILLPPTASETDNVLELYTSDTKTLCPAKCTKS